MYDYMASSAVPNGITMGAIWTQLKPIMPTNEEGWTVIYVKYDGDNVYNIAIARQLDSFDLWLYNGRNKRWSRITK